MRLPAGRRDHLCGRRAFRAGQQLNHCRGLTGCARGSGIYRRVRSPWDRHPACQCSHEPEPGDVCQAGAQWLNDQRDSRDDQHSLAERSPVAVLRRNSYKRTPAILLARHGPGTTFSPRNYTTINCIGRVRTARFRDRRCDRVWWKPACLLLCSGCWIVAAGSGLPIRLLGA